MTSDRNHRRYLYAILRSIFRQEPQTTSSDDLEKRGSDASKNRAINPGMTGMHDRLAHP
jgi:hypothetical protein